MNKVNAIKDKKDLQRMAEWLKEHKYMYYVIFMFAIHSGLRISDILKLDIIDVENKDYIELREQKTGKSKCFPINQNVQNIIKEYLVYRKQKYSLGGEPLFVSQKHYRVERTQVWKVFKQCAKELGIKVKVGCHSTRKTFGYHHFKQFNDIGLLQTILNHSSSAITLRYIDITQEEIDKSYINLDLGI